MSYLITGAIIALLGVFAGAYIQHKAEARETPAPVLKLPEITLKEEDLPAPISPFEEAQKNRRAVVTIREQ